jgi:putative transposase
VIFVDRPYRHVMVSILFALISIFAFRFRSRASLEFELIAVRHQLTVLRRQRPGRPQLSSLDRLLWVWLYRIWPQVIDAMVLVKPATVVQWHRKGFRLHWRWRSRRPGRPKIGTEIRALIRRMSKANPLWGAPRIHGELLKLGIKIQPGYGWALDALASQGPLPDQADLPAQPPARDCGD